MTKAKTIELPARFSDHPRLTAPTCQEVRAMREKAKLTQAQAASMVYVAEDTWRAWEKKPSVVSARGMTAATWELFLLKLGELDYQLYRPRRVEFGRAREAAKVPAVFKRATS